MRVERTALARLLNATTKVVEARNTIPILSTIRLVSDGDKLTGTATDLDVVVTSSLPASGPLAACLDAKMLSGIVAKVQGDEIAIDVADATATIKAGRSRFSLPTLPIEDFPNLTAGSFTAEFEADLSALFAPVQFAISTEETRFYLCGIYLHVDDGHMVAVATDGHRLARHVGQTVEEFAGIIVPRKTVGIVPKGTVTVRLSDAKIQFEAGDTVITSKLIDGTFPDYKRILPTGNDKLVTFDVPAMKKAAERVSVVSNERGRGVKLSIGDGQVTLAINNPESGSATEEITVSHEGEPIDIGFNSAYLSELVGIFPAGDVTMALADAGSPTLFTSAAADGLLAVLMPMRV